MPFSEKDKSEFFSQSLCCAVSALARLRAALYDFTISQRHIWLRLKQVKGHSLPTFLRLQVPLSPPTGIHLSALFGSVTTQMRTESCTLFFFTAVVALHNVSRIKGIMGRSVMGEGFQLAKNKQALEDLPLNASILSFKQF